MEDMWREKKVDRSTEIVVRLGVLKTFFQLQKIFFFEKNDYL